MTDGELMAFAAGFVLLVIVGALVILIRDLRRWRRRS
jgi:hypothetical protein